LEGQGVDGRIILK